MFCRVATMLRGVSTMTHAVCFKCGEMKFGAWVPCSACGARPASDREINLSMAMTDHYFDLETLEQMGAKIKQGIEIQIVNQKGEPLVDIFAEDKNSSRQSKKTGPRSRGPASRRPK